ncbi:zinc finger protein 37 [Musca domestica]|uniref:Zinc finger protein 37 n=1 Tax=Musca domestica TaxID=7370 RepID=A0A1I8MTQ4_MUSDO|nr:zinc finger protein 37 [Musca domestica]
MCVVINLDVVCLVCLHHSAEMHSIFGTTGSSDENDPTIAQKISTLSKLKVDSKNEHLPEKLCDGCLKDLNAAWRFHKNCQTAVAVFQSILKPILQLQEQPKEGRLPDKQDAEENCNEPTSSGQQSQEMTIKDIFEEEEPSQHQLTAVVEANEENAILESMAVDADDLKSVKDVSSNSFGELKRCILEEENEDCQSVDETQGLVEYYLTDENVNENNEEKISKEQPSHSLRNKKDVSTIASKRVVFNSVREETKSMPSTTTTTRRMTHQTLNKNHQERKSEGPEAVKCTKPVRRRQNQQVPSKESQQQNSNQQIDSEDNANQNLSNDESEPKSRKRKMTSAGTKAPKICEICGNSYRFQHALNAHMRRHYDDKPFPCEMCSKAFVSNVELRRHMRVHTGQKPYACQYCDRRFSDYGSRIKHERTHTGERPYVCTTCGKSFAYPHVLSVHLRTHTGEKKFKCSYCPKGFTKKAYLLTHMDTYHSNNVGDVTTYELTLEDDDGDTVETDNEQLADAIFTPDFINDEHEQESGQIQKSEEEIETGDDDENNRSDQMTVPKSLLRLKAETEGEDDTDVQEVEIHLDEYTIRVR